MEPGRPVGIAANGDLDRQSDLPDEPSGLQFIIMASTIKDLLVYTPAKDFELSKSFYSALGFEMTEGWGGTMDCRLGGAAFRLQNYYVKDWAENFMMKFDVDDIPGWYEHAKKVIDTGNYPNARVSEPEMAGDTPIFHVWDPCGVLLIFVG